jgi:hypothetical protein
VVEISEALGVVFSVADDQTVRAIQATSGEELWCSRWAWGRHGPPPERGSIGFMSKAVNFVVGQRSFLFSLLLLLTERWNRRKRRASTSTEMATWAW